MRCPLKDECDQFYGCPPSSNHCVREDGGAVHECPHVRKEGGRVVFDPHEADAGSPVECPGHRSPVLCGDAETDTGQLVPSVADVGPVASDV
jgi:hypothetical protein